jgi:hypothetical protein
MLQAARSRVPFPKRSLDFSLDLILPAALCLWGRLSLQQERVPGISLRVKRGRRVRLTIHRYLWADCLENVGEPWHLITLRASTACYRDSFAKVKVTLRPTISRPSGIRDQFYSSLKFYLDRCGCYFVAPSPLLLWRQFTNTPIYW